MSNQKFNSIRQCIEIWRQREKEFKEQGDELHAEYARECAERFEQMLSQWNVCYTYNVMQQESLCAESV